MLSTSAIANPPFDWPMNTDPKFLQKTADPYLLEIIPEELEGHYIPSLYASAVFDFTIVIDGDVPPEDEVVILSVSLVSVPGFIFSYESEVIGPNTIRVWGDIGSFPGEYYEFLMQDRSIERLEAFNTEAWATILEWKPPATPWTVDGDYVVTVIYDLTTLGLTTTTTETINILQYLHWNWEPSLGALQHHVEEGEF